MKYSHLSAKLSDNFRQKNFIQVLCGFLMFSNIILVCFLFKDQQRVVLVPAQVSQEMWAERRAVSKEYLEEISLFFLNQLLDATPHSMHYQRDVVLRNVDPKVYNKLKAKLIQEEERYKKENLTTTFRPTELQVNRKSLSVKVEGYFTSYVAGKKTKEEKVTYLIKYRFDMGRLFINSVEDENEA